MILIDFRNWIFDKSLDFLPNAKKELLQRDFDALTKITDFNVLDLGAIKPFSISSLFFKNEKQVAVSAIKNIIEYYEIIDNVLEIENKEVVDYSEAAEEDVYFYGSNSLVAHLNSEIASCGINGSSDESLFEEYCEDFEFTPFSFDIPEEITTSDIAFFIGNTLLICLEYITDKKVKKQLFSLLKQNGIKIVTFTKKQVKEGVLDLKCVKEKLLISKKAFDLFSTEQQKEISDLNIEVINKSFLQKTEIRLREIIL